MTKTRVLLAEVLGTFVLVVGGCGAVLAANLSGGTTTIVPIAFGFGLALLAALYAFGDVSGGHFNPAVSLAMLLDRRIDLGTMIGYWVAQVAGGVLAGLALLAVSSREAVGTTATTIGPGIGVWDGFLLEVVFTAVFLLVILRVSVSASSAATAFLGIALTLTTIHLVLVPFTGTSVNPARSLGPAIVGGVWTDQWVYLTAPLLGGAIGWLLYRVVGVGHSDAETASVA
jgi:MIP family channel proteins